MNVRFSARSEYVAELERDQPAVANQRVRVTTLEQPLYNGSVMRVFVIATAKVFCAVPGHEDYDIVEFRRVVGERWGNPTHDDEVVAAANELVAELRLQLEELGFVVAAGMYEKATA
jgi:hypothetical protein